jgi:elongation factor P hydroxylase
VEALRLVGIHISLIGVLARAQNLNTTYSTIDITKAQLIVCASKSHYLKMKTDCFMAKIENAQQLIGLFNSLFRESFNTVLVGGAEEPIYLPADKEHEHNRVVFRHDYISSAFHEIAHWCIAGTERLTKVDFGYWYNPDGRTKEQQKVFESVEIKPQALEWHLSEAAGHKFNLSADNLDGDCGPSESFTLAVVEQAKSYCNNPAPSRGHLLIIELQKAFDNSDSASTSRYERQRLNF